MPDLARTHQAEVGQIPRSMPDSDCQVCGGDGVLPIFTYAIPPGGPDTLPCPFCAPDDPPALIADARQVDLEEWLRDAD